MQGYIIWEGLSAFDGQPIVLIATGFERPSKNGKTGEMIQTFIVRSDVSPLDALASGDDVSICGDCPLRGSVVNGKRTERACYVRVEHSVQSVWQAYKRGSYAKATPAQARALMANQPVRLGAYGDPAMVPFDVIANLVADAKLVTGYTHQWRTCDERFAGLLMASADGTDDYRLARSKGWRSFVVLGQGAELPIGTIECLAARESGPKRQCVTCGACSGTRLGTKPNAVSIAIHAHGIGSKFVTTT
jgi:hypothetical protein